MSAFCWLDCGNCVYIYLYLFINSGLKTQLRLQLITGRSLLFIEFPTNTKGR